MASLNDGASVAWSGQLVPDELETRERRFTVMEKVKAAIYPDSSLVQLSGRFTLKMKLIWINRGVSGVRRHGGEMNSLSKKKTRVS